MTKARIMLVDDHVQVVRGLSLLMALDEGSEVVGFATSGPQAIEKARELLPDVVLMDFSIGEMDGIETAARIRAERPETQVIIVSVYEAGNDAERARRAGIAKWIPKSLPPDVLLEQLRTVVRARNQV